MSDSFLKNKAKHPLFGLALAGLGAMTLTPDSLFIRWSGMGAFEMLVWRGIQMGIVMPLNGWKCQMYQAWYCSQMMA